MKIEIPRVLVHLRGRRPSRGRSDARSPPWPGRSPTGGGTSAAQRLARLGRGLGRLGPLRGWTASRELPQVRRHLVSGVVA